MIKEELKSIKIGKKDLRKFGLAVGGVILLLSFLWLWREGYWPVLLGGVGLALLSLGLIVPPALFFPYKIWMGLSAILGWLSTRLILGIIFYLIITPIGIIARLVGKKFLELEFISPKESYWNKREKVLDEKSQIRKQF